MLSKPSERLYESIPSGDVSRQLLNRALESSLGLLERSAPERGTTEECRDPREGSSERFDPTGLSLCCPNSTKGFKRERLSSACPTLCLPVVRP